MVLYFSVVYITNKNLINLIINKIKKKNNDNNKLKPFLIHKNKTN